MHTQLIDMKIHIGIIFLGLTWFLGFGAAAQQAPSTGQTPATARKAPAPTMTIRQMKDELEKSPNPILYAKQILQKRFKIDTITVTQTRHFGGLADSLAYTGTERKVYGPYGPKGGRYLVQVLNKAPNEFYHISQIFIDTSFFSFRIAESIGTVILKKLKDGSATFEDLSKTYAMAATRRQGGTWAGLRVAPCIR